MSIVPILKGLATYIPGLYRPESGSTGGTNSARYCYSVWLRHLAIAWENGLTSHPGIVAELGPGDSLGIGLAALLSGANTYYAFDVVEYANIERNLSIFDELVRLFKNRERIPDQTEWPGVRPLLKSYEFPHHILGNEWLEESLSPDRIESIRNTVRHPNSENNSDIRITYCAPWYDAAVVREGAVDMIFSQAVLEHVDDLASTYRELHRWLKPGGFMSHEIDFGCHGYARQWNGQWAYSDFLWKLVRGARVFLINREPYATHTTLLRKTGFDIVCELRNRDDSGIPWDRLAPRFRSMKEEDLTTRDALIQAVKKAHHEST